MSNDIDCLTLMIGNSRLHWGYFQREKLTSVWDTPHAQTEDLPPQLGKIPLYIASVVPEKTAFWLNYPQTRLITLNDIPIKNVYHTLGIDRALALWGAIHIYGCPSLVIDAGTALTFTGADDQQQFGGGAILPGLQLQLNSLATKTGALPEVKLPEDLPIRWANNTNDAIASGIIYSVLAGMRDFITDWCNQFSNSKIIITGGDAVMLLHYLQSQQPKKKTHLILDKNLIFWGMAALHL